MNKIAMSHTDFKEKKKYISPVIKARAIECMELLSISSDIDDDSIDVDYDPDEITNDAF